VKIGAAIAAPEPITATMAPTAAPTNAFLKTFILILLAVSSDDQRAERRWLSCQANKQDQCQEKFPFKIKGK
jgi:hypothetical protein